MKRLIIGLVLGLMLMGAALANDLISSLTFDVTGTVTSGAVVTVYLPNTISNHIKVNNDSTTSGEYLYVDFMGYKAIGTITAESDTGRTGTGTNEALDTIGGTIVKASECLIENNFKTSKINLLAKTGTIAYRVHVVY